MVGGIARAAGLTAAAGGAGWGLAHASAPAVRGWAPPRRQVRPAAPLHLTGGPAGAEAGDDTVRVVLLHGIAASGRSFGRAWDGLPGVLVPDLLGFGRSMDVGAGSYDRNAHVESVRRTLAVAGPPAPTVVVGHSMGAVLALHLAAVVPEVVGVVAMGAPLYDDRDEAMARIGSMDAMARLLAVGSLAERVCAWMCVHRRLAGALAPLVLPRWPVPVAHDAVLHTWPAYRQSLEHLVLDSGYRTALAALAAREVPVLLLDGTADPVPVPGRAEAVVAHHPAWRARTVDGADHALPVSHGEACAAEVGEAVRRWA